MKECKNKKSIYSIEEILHAEAEFIKCNSKLFCNGILKWLDDIEDEEKRILLYNQFLEAYTNNINAISCLIRSTHGFVNISKNCKRRMHIKNITSCIYILEVMIIIQKSTRKSKLYFLIYDSRCKKILIAKFDRKYYSRKLKVRKYYVN